MEVLTEALEAASETALTNEENSLVFVQYHGNIPQEHDNSYQLSTFYLEQFTCGPGITGREGLRRRIERLARTVHEGKDADVVLSPAFMIEKGRFGTLCRSSPTSARRSAFWSSSKHSSPSANCSNLRRPTEEATTCERSVLPGRESRRARLRDYDLRSRPFCLQNGPLRGRVRRACHTPLHEPAGGLSARAGKGRNAGESDPSTVAATIGLVS